MKTDLQSLWRPARFWLSLIALVLLATPVPAAPVAAPASDAPGEGAPADDAAEPDPLISYSDAVDRALTAGRYVTATKALKKITPAIPEADREIARTAFKLLGDKALSPDKTVSLPQGQAWKALVPVLRYVTELQEDGPARRRTQALRALGIGLYRSGRLTDAAKVMAEAAALKGAGQEKAHYFLAWIQYKAGDGLAAKEAFAKGKARRRRSPFARLYEKPILAEAAFDGEAKIRKTEHFVFYYPEEEEPFLFPEIETGLEDDYALLKKALGWGLKEKIVVKIHNQPKSFILVADSPLGTDPKQLAGSAILRPRGNVLSFLTPRGAQGSNALPDYRGRFWPPALYHPLAYAFVRERGGEATPLWMQEGVARWLQPEPESRQRDNALAAAAHNRAFGGANLLATPNAATPRQVVLLQALAGVAVRFLVENHGLESLGASLDLFAAGQGPNRMFTDVLKTTPRVFYGKLIRNVAKSPPVYDATDQLYRWGLEEMPPVVETLARFQRVQTPKALAEFPLKLLNAPDPDPTAPNGPADLGAIPRLSREIRYAIALHLAHDAIVKDELDDARELLIQAKTFQKDGLEACLLLAHLYRLDGKPKEAAAELEPALARQPKHSLLQLELGRAYLALKQPGKALPLLKEAQARAPWLPIVNQATAEAILGQAVNAKSKKEALGYLQQQLTVYPYDRATWERLAQCSDAWAERAKRAEETLNDWADEETDETHTGEKP